jgi:hypothetical protein
MSDDRLEGIASRARLWRAQETDPHDGGAPPIGLEDVEDLLAEVYAVRRAAAEGDQVLDGLHHILPAWAPAADAARAHLAQLRGESAQEAPVTWPTP